jgi:hypothetical protein
MKPTTKSIQVNISLILFRTVWNKRYFITIALQLHFRICHQEGPRRQTEPGTEWDTLASSQSMLVMHTKAMMYIFISNLVTLILFVFSLVNNLACGWHHSSWKLILIPSVTENVSDYRLNCTTWTAIQNWNVNRFQHGMAKTSTMIIWPPHKLAHMPTSLPMVITTKFTAMLKMSMTGVLLFVCKYCNWVFFVP